MPTRTRKLALSAALTLAVCLSVSPAPAAVVIDQEQTVIDPVSPVLIGLGQEVAQTVTAGINGRLVAVDLPLTCASGRLIVEIVRLEGDQPGSHVSSSATLEGADLPTDLSAFTTVTLDRSVPQSAGNRFAIVARNETGDCHTSALVPVDPYSRGNAFVANSILPRWTEHLGSDRAFRTRVDASSPAAESPCQVSGLGPLPIPVPSFAPVCRCLRDAGLREFRCGLMHPDMFLLRRFPSPFDAGKPFEVEWTLMALAPIEGEIQLTDRWPAGYQTSLTGPLSFDGANLAPGQTVTFTYQVTTPSALGKEFKLRTDVHVDEGDIADGFMETRVEVPGKKP